jgi:hypothetical protein
MSDFYFEDVLYANFSGAEYVATEDIPYGFGVELGDDGGGVHSYPLTSLLDLPPLVGIATGLILKGESCASKILIRGPFPPETIH